MSLNVSHDDLAARLEQHARIHDEHVPFDSEQARWAADLRAAAEVVRGASAQPQAAGWRLPENATEPMQKAMQRAVLMRKSMNDVWRAALAEINR